MYNCIWVLVVYRGVRLGRVFVMDDVSNRVYSGPRALYILNPIDPFFSLPTRRLVATSVTMHALIQIL